MVLHEKVVWGLFDGILALEVAWVIGLITVVVYEVLRVDLLQRYLLDLFEMCTYVLFSQIIVFLRIPQDNILDFLEFVLGQDLEDFILRVLLEDNFADQDIWIIILVNQIGIVNVVVFWVIIEAQNRFSWICVTAIITFDEAEVFRTKLRIWLHRREIKLALSRGIKILEEYP